MFKNLNFGKSGFKSCVLEKHSISYSCILFLIFNALRSFFLKTGLLFFKNSVFPKFRLIQPIFLSIEIVLKNYCESLSVSINWNWFSINRKSCVKFLKNHIWLIQITFSNSFFSLRFGQAQSSIFCRFRPNILQGFPLLRPVCPLYPFFFIYFQFFMHWRVIFGLSIFWGFLWFKPFFVKLIIGFLFYDVINMILVV